MNVAIQRNLLGELLIMKELKIKPNFSALQRNYGTDRHTIKKYYCNPEIKRKPCIKPSKYTCYHEEIKELLLNSHVTIMGAYQYLNEKYPDAQLNYNGLKHYVRIKGLVQKRNKAMPHIRFETSPGEQLQVDWKENLSLISQDGEIINFNIFSATLGFSRNHTFIYSKGKTTEDFLRCTIDTLQLLGGKPKHILTDNMSAVVSVTNGYRKKHAIIQQFEKDCGINIKLCKVRTPQTKGKVESSNRFVNWLYAYNGKFKDESELISIIKNLNIKANTAVNQTTNIPPIKLFAKEKEYLQPLPPKVLLDNYICNTLIKVVPPTLLVDFNGNGYSVPSKFIGKRVKLLDIEHKLYIYYNTELIACHPVCNKKFNYLQSHYQDALSVKMNKDDNLIEEMAKNNLDLIEYMYGRNKYE